MLGSCLGAADWPAWVPQGKVLEGGEGSREVVGEDAIARVSEGRHGLFASSKWCESLREWLRCAGWSSRAVTHESRNVLAKA